MSANLTLRPCRFPQCPAFAVMGRETCTVHLPEKIVERARCIVQNNFGPAIASGGLDSMAAIKLRDDILHQLQETV